ncbi:MAG: alpha-amylase family glycosyl hydrolase, partial [Pseudomonadota bacterium]
MPANWKLEYGANVLAEGGVTFRAWAPCVRELAVRVLSPSAHTVAMHPQEGSVFEVTVPDARPGVDYYYVLDGAKERPDPASRWQPSGVHGPSRVVDPRAFSWSDHGWDGIPLDDLVIYELHVGTFSAAGTFAGVAARLPYLRELGVTAVELMPVAEFPGNRNWGYDGAHPFAPHSSYGGPDGLKRLVEAAHRSGLGIILDVVYNHLGPEGNYLGEYGPYFSNRYKTPWGEALNFDGPESDQVRRHFV